MEDTGHNAESGSALMLLLLSSDYILNVLIISFG